MRVPTQDLLEFCSWPTAQTKHYAKAGLFNFKQNLRYLHTYLYVFRYMNMSFTNAVLCDPQGNEYHFDQLFVQARNIRYVHIPETVSIFRIFIA